VSVVILRVVCDGDSDVVGVGDSDAEGDAVVEETPKA